MHEDVTFSFFSIIKKYIYYLVRPLKIKVIKQDNTGYKTYIRHIPLYVNSVHRCDMKYI